MFRSIKKVRLIKTDFLLLKIKKVNVSASPFFDRLLNYFMSQIGNMISNGDSADVSSINQGRSTIFMRGNFFEVKKFSEGATSANTLGLPLTKVINWGCYAKFGSPYRTVCVAEVAPSENFFTSKKLHLIKSLVFLD